MRQLLSTALFALPLALLAPEAKAQFYGALPPLMPSYYPPTQTTIYTPGNRIGISQETIGNTVITTGRDSYGNRVRCTSEVIGYETYVRCN